MKKKLDNYEQQKMNRRQDELASPLMQVDLPGVAFVEISMEYEDCSIATQKDRFTKTRHAYFNLECPLRECVGGGFDLSQVVYSMVEKSQPEMSGRVHCEGGIMAGSIKKNSCMLGMDYKINISYEKCG